jgi:hypothetical protein
LSSFLHRNVFAVSLAVAAIGLAIAACAPVPPFYEPTAPADVREACKLTERRCTACHDRDRIVNAHYSREEWPTIVERMRQMPGSTIAPTETDTILHCLLNRTDSGRSQ